MKKKDKQYFVAFARTGKNGRRVGSFKIFGPGKNVKLMSKYEAITLVERLKKKGLTAYYEEF